jgi:hypothetical protein
MVYETATREAAAAQRATALAEQRLQQAVQQQQREQQRAQAALAEAQQQQQKASQLSAFAKRAQLERDECLEREWERERSVEHSKLNISSCSINNSGDQEELQAAVKEAARHRAAAVALEAQLSAERAERRHEAANALAAQRQLVALQQALDKSR